MAGIDSPGRVGMREAASAAPHGSLTLDLLSTRDSDETIFALSSVLVVALVVTDGARVGLRAEAAMAEEEANLTDEERAELERPVIEDEDFDVEQAPDESLDTPSDLPDGDIEDASDFREEMVDDDDPVLEMSDGTRVGVGSLE
jgi:hypothetical protein